MRLDGLRGLLQLTIFLGHAALIGEGASWLGGWIIHTAWGFSDSSEQFIFTSGLGLGSVFTLKRLRDGERAAFLDIFRRSWRLYRTHLLLFAGFGAVVIAGAHLLPLPDEIARMGWNHLLDRPWVALPLTPILVYQPQFMEILPIFILCTLAVAPFLALVERVGDAALLAPLALWLLVQATGVALPALGPDGHSMFGLNPFAWQFLYLLGAWVGRRALLSGGRAVPRARGLIAACVAYLAYAFLARIATYGWIGGIPIPPLALVLKEDLGPFRLLHGLAIAYLAAVLLPRDAAWLHRGLGAALAATGRHSLQAYLLGLFLSWGVSATLRTAGYSLALDALLCAAGCALLLAWGSWLDARREAKAIPASAQARG
jgi:hypothetical protein